MISHDIVASGYEFNIEFPNGLDVKQHIYSELMAVFKHTINLLSSYPHNHPLNPTDRDAYMRQSRICKKKITDLQARFIDGMINLDEIPLIEFRFLIAREINDSIHELHKKLTVKFSYPRLHEHFREKVLQIISWHIFRVIPFGEYNALDAKFPQEVSA